MKILLSALLLSTFTLAGTAQAPGAKTDLSGSWKIDLSKSDFGPAPPPSAQTETITQTGDDITIVLDSTGDQGTQKYTLTLKAGGPEVPFPATNNNGSPLVIISNKAEWQGAALLVTEKAAYQDNPITLKITYTLSPDGKFLTKNTHISAEMADFDLRAVYNKA